MSRNRERTKQHPNYMSFLLRLYCVDDKEGLVWRMSLESSLTGERVGFASLDALFAFLKQQMGAMIGADRGEFKTDA